MKAKLLSIFLVLSLALSFTACKNVSETGTPDTETTEAEDTENYDQPRIEPSLWALKADTPYAIVKVTGTTEETEQPYDKDFYYKKFTYEQIYSTLKNFPNNGTLYVAEDPEQKLNPGDSIFFEVEDINSEPNKCYVHIGSRQMSEYKIFTDGTIELTDNDLHDIFYPIYVFNEHVSEKREWAQEDSIDIDSNFQDIDPRVQDIDPSFPTKELYGKVTVEEISNFLDSVKKASYEYFEFWSSPEIRKYYRI